MNTKTKLEVSIGLAAFVCVGVSAQEGFMPWTDIMHMYSHGKSGVTMEDVKDHDLNAKFPGFAPLYMDHYTDLDTNKDGMVDEAEMKAMVEKMQWSDKQMVNQFYSNQGFMPANPANQ